MDRELISKELDINRVVFIGRTFDEYMKMFNLSLESLKNKKVLDCPAELVHLQLLLGKKELIQLLLILFIFLSIKH